MRVIESWSIVDVEAHMDTPAQQDLVLRFGPFELNPAAEELRENGSLRRLPPQPFRVLLLLAGRAGQIVSREEIRHCLWGERKYVDVERGINFCVNQIRSALRDPAEISHYIKTLPRRGYCFAAVSEPLAPSTGVATSIVGSASSERNLDAAPAVRVSGHHRVNNIGVASRILGAVVVQLIFLLIPTSGEYAKPQPIAALRKGTSLSSQTLRILPVRKCLTIP
jgi:DNA-binding winged helix-turn-helix (wHTH) protein